MTPDPDALPALPPPDEREPTPDELKTWWNEINDLLEMKRERAMTEEQRLLHAKTLGLDDETEEKRRARWVQPGSPAACVYPGCSSPGSVSAGKTASRHWYCYRHYEALRKGTRAA